MIGSNFLFFCLFRAGRIACIMEVPRLVVQWELQPPAYATATATPDPSRVCNLHHSSQQCQIRNPLSEARDQTYLLKDASQIHFCCTMPGTPRCGIAGVQQRVAGGCGGLGVGGKWSEAGQLRKESMFWRPRVQRCDWLTMLQCRLDIFQASRSFIKSSHSLIFLQGWGECL